MLIYLCPTDKRYACSWEGTSDQILDHFQQEHDDLIHFCDNFTIDLKTPSENRLLIIEEEIYLAQTKISNETLTILLRFLGPQQIAKSFEFSLELCNDENLPLDKKLISLSQSGGYELNLQHVREEIGDTEEIKCSVQIAKLELNEISTNKDEETVIEHNDIVIEPSEDQIDIGIKPKMKMSSQSMRNLRSTVYIPALTRKVSLSEFSQRTSFSEAHHLWDNLEPIQETLNDLVCSNCKTVMLPPIYLCLQGHNVCKNCKHNLCMTCNDLVTDTRNENLEKKSREHQHSCKYSSHGCGAKYAYDEIRTHETRCIYCDYKCPMPDCTFKGQFKQMKHHFKLLHGSTKMNEDLFAHFPRDSEFFLLCEAKGIFYCKSTLNSSANSILWTVQFCGPEERNFIFELKFRNSSKPGKVFKRYTNVYMTDMKLLDLKKMKLKDKNAVLVITIM